MSRLLCITWAFLFWIDWKKWHWYCIEETCSVIKSTMSLIHDANWWGADWFSNDGALRSESKGRWIDRWNPVNIQWVDLKLRVIPSMCGGETPCAPLHPIIGPQSFTACIWRQNAEAEAVTTWIRWTACLLIACVLPLFFCQWNSYEPPAACVLTNLFNGHLCVLSFSKNVTDF